MQIKALGCSDHLHFVRSVNIGCQTNHWKGISQNQAYWESVVVGLCTYTASCKQSGCAPTLPNASTVYSMHMVQQQALPQAAGSGCVVVCLAALLRQMFPYKQNHLLSHVLAACNAQQGRQQQLSCLRTRLAPDVSFCRHAGAHGCHACSLACRCEQRLLFSALRSFCPHTVLPSHPACRVALRIACNKQKPPINYPTTIGCETQRAAEPSSLLHAARHQLDTCPD